MLETETSPDPPVVAAQMVLPLPAEIRAVASTVTVPPTDWAETPPELTRVD